MLNSLYIKAIAKRGTIKEIIPNNESKLSIEDYWEDKKIFESPAKFSIGAGDGSYNKKKFLNSNFYAVAAESLIFDNELKQIEYCDLEQIEPVSFLDELLSYYMSIFELKCSLRAIRDYNVDYYYIDGSIYGDLLNPYPKGAKSPFNFKEDISGDVLDRFVKAIHEMEDDGLSFMKIKKHPLLKPFNKNIYERDLYLSSFERLLVLKELLEYPKQIISISKSSSANDIFESNIPDIAIFDKYTTKQGISSKILYLTVSNNVNVTFPVYDKFFKELIFTVFYARLEDNKSVLKIELPYEASRDEVYSIVEKIKKYSTDGYPYLLNKAHNDVVITDRNIKELIKIAKINEKTNREMLG